VNIGGVEYAAMVTAVDEANASYTVCAFLPGPCAFIVAAADVRAPD